MSGEIGWQVKYREACEEAQKRAIWIPNEKGYETTISNTTTTAASILNEDIPPWDICPPEKPDNKIAQFIDEEELLTMEEEKYMKQGFKEFFKRNLIKKK